MSESLAHVSHLFALPERAWHELAAHLRRIGVAAPRVAEVVAATRDLHPVLRRAVRNHHLRRHEDPAILAMRLLLFADPVTGEQARAALGDRLGPLLEVGFLRRLEGGRVACSFVLALVNDLFILSDDLACGGDAVMGLADTTTELCRAAFPDAPKGSALDLGCGSGTLALVLAAAVRRVVATDINPRAVAMTRFNAMWNGIRNVEARQGDLFAPVAGERFDLVVSQPPFIPMPEGADDATFLHGGHRGDELPLALLSRLAPHLAPSGRAVLRVDWPRDREPLAQRLRAALGESGDLLVLEAPPVSADEHAAAYAAGLHPLLDDAFEREVASRRENLERAHISEIVPTLTVVGETGAPAGRTMTMPVRPLTAALVTNERIDEVLKAGALADDPPRLLAARLRVPEGTVLAQEQVGPGAEVESSLFARLPAPFPSQPVPIPADLLFLVTFLHEAPDVRTGLSRFAEHAEADEDETARQLLPVIQRALAAGLLMPG